uniref:Uncharacterized protein n=1 Tax=Rhizophora mucronata TaxID=61149 RepID=A0A2P2NCM0_RHIMU
MIRFMVGSLA